MSDISLRHPLISPTVTADRHSFNAKPITHHDHTLLFSLTLTRPQSVPLLIDMQVIASSAQASLSLLVYFVTQSSGTARRYFTHRAQSSTERHKNQAFTSADHFSLYLPRNMRAATCSPLHAVTKCTTDIHHSDYGIQRATNQSPTQYTSVYSSNICSRAIVLSSSNAH